MMLNNPLLQKYKKNFTNFRSVPKSESIISNVQQSLEALEIQQRTEAEIKRRLERYNQLEIDDLPNNWKTKLTEHQAIKSELEDWKKQFGSQTPEQVQAELNNKSSGLTLTPEQEHKLNNYDALKKERDDLLVKSIQKPKEKSSPLSKKIADEIIKAYKAPKYLFSYYLKLMKTFQDWEVYGTEEQKQASRQNKGDLERVIKFLNDYQN
jgi:hypothetical protein